jgi:predicted transcriptional regulator of viral defense system
MTADSEIRPQAKRAIQATFKRFGNRSLSRDVLADLLTPANRRAWGLPSISAHRFVNDLVKQKLLSELRLEFPSRNVIRYLHGSPSPYVVAQSINRDGYLSHFTAMHLHQLTEQLPKTIYLNVEQQQSPGGGELDQESIDRSFKRPCRVTHNAAVYDSLRIVVLNGGNTACLGVKELATIEDAPLRVTGIERTLIDAVVRPTYSGGVFEVAKAYRAARERASVQTLAKMLNELDYTYPYHQAVGFYMERAGFPASEVELMREYPIEFDFYLDYAMRQKEYDSRWRLHIPKGF